MDILEGMVNQASPTAPATPSRILVVDDDEVTLDFVELGLRYEGFDVTRALDGQEALRAVERRRMDLIVLDLNLPTVDGVEVCQRIRERDDTPIIMLTARADVDERVAGLEAGADDYLPKPFKFKELLARIRAVMRRRVAPEQTQLAKIAVPGRDDKAVVRRVIPDFPVLRALQAEVADVRGPRINVLEASRHPRGQVIVEQQFHGSGLAEVGRTAIRLSKSAAKAKQARMSSSVNSGKSSRIC